MLCSMKTGVTAVAVAVVVLSSSAAIAGVDVPFTESFDAGHANWWNGAASAPLDWLANGGADGGGYVTTDYLVPDEPPEFVWDLSAETAVEALRLRQNPLFPAQRVEILGGGSPDDWQTLWETDMPDKPAGDKNKWSVFRVLDRAATVRFLKLRILSGHGDEFWGLDAIEVFGSGPDPRPELEPCRSPETTPTPVESPSPAVRSR